MRRLLPLLLVALAACQVDIEGAPCRGLGLDTADCPGGQGCGLDQKCSKRASASSCALCTVGAVRCEDTNVQQCIVSNDPVCGEWATAVACEGGLVCGDKSGAPSCQCPPNAGPEFAADPAGSRSLDAAPYPTGVSSPPACRFGRLGDALAAASAHAAAHPDTGAVALAYGEPPVTFGAAETFPLDIASGVLLGTVERATSNPANWIIRADTASTTDVITLHDGAGVEGLTIQSVSVTGDVVRLACASQAKATLNRLVIDGGGVAARGVAVAGPCDLEATELSITGAAGTGLYVNVDLANASEPVTGVSISAGSIGNNGGSGVEVLAGRLSLAGTATQPFEIVGNGAYGVIAKSRSGPSSVAAAIDVAIDSARISANGETGVFLRDLLPGSKATIRFTGVHENQALTQASVFYGSRRAGGIVLWGAKVPVVFKGNQVWGNKYDQVGILSSDAWDLSGDGATCGVESNVFACPDGDHTGKLVYGASLKEQLFGGAFWSEFPPSTLTVGVSYQPICGPDSTKLPLCPVGN